MTDEQHSPGHMSTLAQIPVADDDLKGFQVEESGRSLQQEERDDAERVFKYLQVATHGCSQPHV